MEAREKILETATRLFSAQGFGSTSLSQVAKEANVSKALVFWHFETKENLFRSALQRSLEPYFINVVDELENLDEIGQVLKLVDLYGDFVRDHLQSIRFVLNLLITEEPQPADPVDRIGELFRIFRSLITDALESGRKEGRLRSELDPTSEAALIMATLNGALLQRFVEPDGASDRLLEHLKALIVDRLKPAES